MAHDLVTELLQYSSLACFMAIWQLCANLLIPNCLRSNLSYSPLAALELYVNNDKKMLFSWYLTQNDYTPSESFCAASVEWKSLHSVGEQPSFVLKIR